MYLAQQGLNSLLLAWESNTIYPINVRYRIKDKTSWVDTLVYDGNQLLLDHLEPCTEYELQIKMDANAMNPFIHPFGSTKQQVVVSLHLISELSQKQIMMSD